MSGVNATRVLMSVQTCISELTAEESRGELRRSRVIFGGHVSLSRLGSIAHAGGLEEGVTYLECLFRVLNFMNLGREFFRLDVHSLDSILVLFDLFIYKYVKFSLLTHLFKHFMLVSLLRVLQSQFTLSSLTVHGGVLSLDRVMSSFMRSPLGAIASILSAEERVTSSSFSLFHVSLN